MGNDFAFLVTHENLSVLKIYWIGHRIYQRWLWL